MNKYIIILLLFSWSTANSQIVINEFSAANSNTIEDPAFGKYSDWIELYNTSQTTINIKGYALTDNFDNTNKWFFTEDILIEPESHLLVWADGMDINLHTNFKLSAQGEEIALFNPQQELIDSISYNYQKSDLSIGRSTDGNKDWGFFQVPTPQAPNITTAYKGFVTQIPEFTLRGGFYNSSVTVEITSLFGGEIRYTTNGTEPEINDPLYSSTLQFNKTTIIRARLFFPDLIPGPVITQSYFINENSVGGKLPVVSIATNPDNFWDATDGIYVQDFKPLWEVPINVEFFENNGADRAAFNEPAGTKVNGLWSWKLPQKMLGVYFKKQYGSSNLDFPLFSQRQRASFKSFALRASGNDWSYTLFRDVLGQHATLLNMNIDIMSFRPAILYVNGEYMGINNLREKVDDDYIEKSYNLESETFDLVENENFAEAGDLKEYNDFLNILHRDLSSQSNFDAVAEIMDIENFSDYIITELATANTSITHNVMAWKPKNESKWKWILMDLDRGFFNPTDHLIDFYLGKDVWPFSDLFENEGYRQYFGQRLSAHLFTSFHPDRMNALIDEHQQLIEDEIPQHIERWLGTTSSYGNAMPSVSYWLNKVNDLKIFCQTRPQALLADLNNYGFNGTINLSLATYPENAGTFYIDGLKSAFSDINGNYLKDVTVELLAKKLPGYVFKGWTQSIDETIISKQTEWKYFDEGSDLGSTWLAEDYDDQSWDSGLAILGYGQGNENTTISYGNDAQNKSITSYFRKTFTLTEKNLNANGYVVNLLKDDGAVVYLNGIEILRSNMPDGTINYQTKAASSISGSSENEYTSFSLDTSALKIGTNVIAVEIHQRTPESSDLSFDLELIAYFRNSENYISTNELLSIDLSEDIDLIAIFEETTECTIPEIISADLTLHKDCSPYIAKGNIVVNENATLTIESGVEILMPNDASILVNGAIIALGTPNENISFKHNPNSIADRWGILYFKNSNDTSKLSYVIIEDASQGLNPTLEIAAISAFNAVVELDNITIENVFGNPISARYSDIRLTNSSLHSSISGDLINVKYGKAYIENCQFIGNDQPDTDAIDYDEIEDGVIKNCEIINFYGTNSDAVDIGEKATNILIDSICVNSITDKGVSIGQQSSATIKNSLFVNCNMGIALKDSSRAIIDKNTFYNNVDAVACFEKNIGKAGGNAQVTNNIISNSTNNSVYADKQSNVLVTYNLSDTDWLDETQNNINQNPYFENPTFYNFNLLSNSPAKNAGFETNSNIDLGIKKYSNYWQVYPVIVQLFTNPLNNDYPEFIAIHNPSDKSIDLSNYSITKGFTATIPEGTSLGANDTLFITDNSSSPRWSIQTNSVIQWEEGKLSNNGESIQLENSYGIVIDYINYNDSIWPTQGFTENMIIKLKSSNLDNHFAENWEVENIDKTLDTSRIIAKGNFLIYPNPTSGRLTIRVDNLKNENANIYNTSGQIVMTIPFNEQIQIEVDLSELRNGLYFFRLGKLVNKLMIQK